jgi:energy-coupling factor transporter transmembrane protein EcfT
VGAVIRLGEYRSGNSSIHGLDPRVKLLSVIALSVLIFGATPFEILLISGFLAAVFMGLRWTPVDILRTLRPVAIFMGLIFIAHLLFTEGRPILSLTPLPLRITQEGLVRGLYAIWQFAALVLAAAVLTLTTSPSDLVAGIDRLLRPLSRIGIPSQDLSVMIATALRFMPMLLEEYDRIRTAQSARGADLATGSLSSRMRAGSTLIVPLIFSAFRRADELAEAMEARGYRRGTRTTLCDLALSRHDWTSAAVMTAFLLMNLAFRIAIL